MENKARILRELMELSPVEKANIVDLLLKSLDEPDVKLDSLWAKEAESRIDAFEKGQLISMKAEEFFHKGSI